MNKTNEEDSIAYYYVWVEESRLEEVTKWCKETLDEDQWGMDSKKCSAKYESEYRFIFVPEVMVAYKLRWAE